MAQERRRAKGAFHIVSATQTFRAIVPGGLPRTCYGGLPEQRRPGPRWRPSEGHDAGGTYDLGSVVHDVVDGRCEARRGDGPTLRLWLGTNPPRTSTIPRPFPAPDTRCPVSPNESPDSPPGIRLVCPYRPSRTRLSRPMASRCRLPIPTSPPYPRRTFPTRNTSLRPSPASKHASSDLPPLFRSGLFSLFWPRVRLSDLRRTSPPRATLSRFPLPQRARPRPIRRRDLASKGRSDTQGPFDA